MANALTISLVTLAIARTAAGASDDGPPAPETRRDYTSRAPRFTFSESEQVQQVQLHDNPLLRRFRESRRRLAGDPQRPIYHFSSPEAPLNDPNGLCFWRGRWHLFYQTKPPEDGRWHWGHAVSDDLIHWRDLPYAIYPHPEEQCYSGSTLVEDDRVIAMYHGRELGNMVAVSHDPFLLNWEKVGGDTVIPLHKDGKRFHFLSSDPLPYRVYDPCIWSEGGVYYSLSGSTQYSGPGGKPVVAEFLFRSKDLATWEFVHQFVENDRFTQVGDDGACPYFWPIGGRHMLLFFSHTTGGQYLLGDYDRRLDKFFAAAHGKFNFGPVAPGGVHAPSAAPDGTGGVIAIFNVNPAMPGQQSSGIMTLPRRLTLFGRDELRMAPAGDIESLRKEPRRVAAMTLPPNQEIVLPAVGGSAVEIVAEIDAGDAPLVELNVLRSPKKEEFTRIALFKNRHVTSRFLPPQQELCMISLDGSRSSQLPEALSRPPETAPVLIPPNEPFRLRVFVDHGIVEVFVNERQCVAMRVHPGRADSLGVSLLAQGRQAKLNSLAAWPMHGIYETASSQSAAPDPSRMSGIRP